MGLVSNLINEILTERLEALIGASPITLKTREFVNDDYVSYYEVTLYKNLQTPWCGFRLDLESTLSFEKVDALLLECAKLILKEIEEQELKDEALKRGFISIKNNIKPFLTPRQEIGLD